MDNNHIQPGARLSIDSCDQNVSDGVRASSGVTGVSDGVHTSASTTSAGTAGVAGAGVSDGVHTSPGTTSPKSVPKKKKTLKERIVSFWTNLNYTVRLTLTFAGVAALTTLCTIFVVSIVWGMHFTNYTQENMQNTAVRVADKVAQQYEIKHEWTSETVAAASYVEMAYPGVGVMVLDRYGNVLYDSSAQENSTSRPLRESDKISTAPIVSGDRVVGSVRLWVSGSQSMLRDTDIQFEERSYQALILAAIFAMFLAAIIGFLVARSLVRPINRMTKTVQEMKNGNLSARTKIKGDDEISKLAQSFDEMAESIENDRNLERRLTNDVAHELRTPLMAIQSTVEAMIDNVFPADEAHLTTVNSEVQRLSRLVDSLLKLSRLENRANAMKRELVDVGQLVQSIADAHFVYVEESGLSLKTDIEPDVYVMGDADMIRQATANLISNAVRYTPEGGRIWLRAHKGEIMASISVEDTGIGLTPEEAKMVFSRFWRADSGRQRESGGLGIGLSVVKEIVDRHGGWVHVEGKKGIGSCFTIYIPLYDEAHEARLLRAKARKKR